jgi:4-methylaminobutanoate oxidase (formaldehyde-forming)
VTKTLPSHAEIVIVGGGILGCSTAYHLAKNGCKDVVLLERAKLTSGTTWHSAAMVRQLRSTVSLTQLTKYSTELYSSLAEETGQETGWIKCGSISIASTPDRMTHNRRQGTLARAFNVEAWEIGIDEIADYWPIANLDDVIGGIYSPNDGRVNPSDTCAALVKGAKMRGVSFYEDTAVTNIRVTNGRVSGVETAEGTITCDKLVVCSGLWSRRVGLMMGASIPLNPCEHYAIMTKAIDGVRIGMPIIGDHDNHMYIRDEVGGLLIGCFEPNARAIDLADLPNDFCFDLLKEDWDHFEPIIEGAIRRIPALESAEIKTLINGPESFTTDGNFLMGEAPELAGLFVGCGMNSMGMASGGGVGRALAEWVINGEPTLDLSSVDIRRFGRFRNNLATLKERSAEMLSKHYAISYPGREPETARNVRLTPLHSAHERNNAQFGERSGWERPNFFIPENTPFDPTLTYGKPGWFDIVAEEHKAAREKVAIFDQSPFGKLQIEGRDVVAYLQRVAANNVDVPVGRLVYTPLLNKRGGYESDAVLMRLASDRYLFITGTAQTERDLHWLSKQRRDDEWVTLVNVTSAYAVISVMGPNARTLLKRVSNASFSNADFPFMTHQEIEIGKTVARAARVSYVGELGWEIHIASDQALPVYNALLDAGQGLGLRCGGTVAMGGLRLEKGYCSWGHDIGTDDTPLHAGMGFTVKFDKGCDFIGRDALLKQRESGINRRRILLKADDPEVMLQGSETIIVDGRVCGHTTSAAYGYTIGSAVAMGYMSLQGADAAALVKQGKFEIEAAGKRHAATASLQALHDPKGARMKVDDGA